jgi:hypothetical protein
VETDVGAVATAIGDVASVVAEREKNQGALADRENTMPMVNFTVAAADQARHDRNVALVAAVLANPGDAAAWQQMRLVASGGMR